MVPEIWEHDRESHESPPNKPENQLFEKMKKTPGDIILHFCIKDRDHMVNCS